MNNGNRALLQCATLHGKKLLHCCPTAVYNLGDDGHKADMDDEHSEDNKRHRRTTHMNRDTVPVLPEYNEAPRKTIETNIRASDIRR